jgi:inorganic triphosphatase YgiF
MAIEVELKLSLPEFAVPAFIALAKQTNQPLGVSQGEPLLLDNQYFDTDDLALNKTHAALRIRKSQYGYKQTLKNKGKTVGGLHQRGEWEYNIDQPEIDWSLFPEELNIDPVLKNAIKPIFKTDFARQVWIKKYGESEIELVLDQGSIHNHNKSYSLCEVELELVSGQAQDLFAFAQDLATSLPLVPCDINKAERGYGLTANISFYQAPDFSEQFQSNLDINLFLQDALTRINRHWDQFSYTKDWWKILVLSRDVQAIEYMISCLSRFESLDNGVHEARELSVSWKQLKHEFVELLVPARVIIALFVDEHSNSRGLSQRLLQILTNTLNDNIQKWISRNTFGRSMLLLGDYLYKFGSGLNTQNDLNTYIWQHIDTLMARAVDMPVKQFEDLQSIQTLAFIYKRFDHAAYQACNQLVKQHLVVMGMSDVLDSSIGASMLTDKESRAKLASWSRRLTVEQRRLHSAREQLIDVM